MATLGFMLSDTRQDIRIKPIFAYYMSENAELPERYSMTPDGTVAVNSTAVNHWTQK